MATIKCLDCGNDVSDNASACIWCGALLQTKDSNLLHEQQTQNATSVTGSKHQKTDAPISSIKKDAVKPAYTKAWFWITIAILVLL